MTEVRGLAESDHVALTVVAIATPDFGQKWPRADYGTYNLTNGGEATSWAEIAAEVFMAAGKDRGAITGVSTAEYFTGKQAAPRPLNSVLDLSRIRNTGFAPEQNTI